jgi:pyruvate/2-oxoglutarate dehydrogenase complex dihydrolipoamide acyltransferase (E2) component
VFLVLLRPRKAGNMDIVLPQLGETVIEGTVTRWFKKVGDAVKADEPLFEVSTDKVDTEVPSPATGVIAEILVQEGETVAVGTVIARLSTADAVATAAPQPQPQTQPLVPIAPVAAAVHVAQTPAAASKPQPAPVLSPVVRRLAETNDLDTSTMDGSGPGGRVTRQDVETVIAQRNTTDVEPAQPTTVEAPVQRVASTPAVRQDETGPAAVSEDSSTAASLVTMSSLSKAVQDLSVLSVLSYAVLRAADKTRLADPSFAVEVSSNAKTARVRIDKAGDLRLSALHQRIQEAVSDLQIRSVSPSQLRPSGVVVRHESSSQLSYSPDASSVVVTLGAIHRSVGVIGDGIGVVDAVWLTVTSPSGNTAAAPILKEVISELCRDWSSEY